MAKMKKIKILLVVIVLLVSGCLVDKEETNDTSSTKAEENQEAVYYYPDKDIIMEFGYKLHPVMNFTIEEDEEGGSVLSLTPENVDYEKVWLTINTKNEKTTSTGAEYAKVNIEFCIYCGESPIEIRIENPAHKENVMIFNEFRIDTEYIVFFSEITGNIYLVAKPSEGESEIETYIPL